MIGFINKNNKIRSGYKIVVFFIIYIALSQILFRGLIEVLKFIISKSTGSVDKKIYLIIKDILYNSQYGMLMIQIISMIALFLTLLILLRVLENKELNYIGFNSLMANIKGLSYGLLAGMVSMSTIFFILLFSGNIYLENSLLEPNFTKGTFLGIILFIIVGVNEEVMCRGYILNTLNETLKPSISIVTSSAIFALLHLLNPDVNINAIINIFLVGILFCYMYAKSKSLWMPIGYHITWNYFQGNVFGFPISGNAAKGLYNIKIVKNNILTGGGFGPEAGILTTIIIIINIFIINKVIDK